MSPPLLQARTRHFVPQGQQPVMVWLTALVELGLEPADSSWHRGPHVAVEPIAQLALCVLHPDARPRPGGHPQADWRRVGQRGEVRPMCEARNPLTVGIQDTSLIQEARFSFAPFTGQPDAVKEAKEGAVGSSRTTAVIANAPGPDRICSGDHRVRSRRLIRGEPGKVSLGL